MWLSVNFNLIKQNAKFDKIKAPLKTGLYTHCRRTFGFFSYLDEEVEDGKW